MSAKVDERSGLCKQSLLLVVFRITDYVIFVHYFSPGFNGFCSYPTWDVADLFQVGGKTHIILEKKMLRLECPSDITPKPDRSLGWLE